MKRKKSLSLILILLLMTVGLRGEVKTICEFSSHTLTDNNTLTYTDSSQILYNDIPNPTDLKSPDKNTHITYLKKKNPTDITKILYNTLDGAHCHNTLPTDITTAHINVTRECHPSDEIIKYIHDQDGEKDRTPL